MKSLARHEIIEIRGIDSNYNDNYPEIVTCQKVTHYKNPS